MWNLVSKYNSLHFWPPEKSVFELMTNLRFSSSESGPGGVHIPQNQYFYLSFQTFKGTLRPFNEYCQIIRFKDQVRDFLNIICEFFGFLVQFKIIYYEREFC